MLKLLIPSAIAALLYKYGKNVSAAADRLEYAVKSIRFELHLLKPSIIHLGLTITNPTRTGLFFDRIDISGKWNETAVGSVVLEKRTTINSNSSADVVLPFLISGVNVAKAIWNAIKVGKPGKLTATGNIIAGIVKVPVEIEQSLEGLKP